MKWLAQLKIQERGRAVALKEAAAVQQTEKKPHKKNPTHSSPQHQDACAAHGEQDVVVRMNTCPSDAAKCLPYTVRTQAIRMHVR